MTPEQWAEKVDLRGAMVVGEPGIDMDGARNEIARVIRDAIAAAVAGNEARWQAATGKSLEQAESEAAIESEEFGKLLGTRKL